MAILLDVLAHFGVVLQFVDGEDHEALVTQSVSSASTASLTMGSLLGMSV
jgi:hypothetical protein